MITFLHDKLKSLLLILLGVVGISFIFFGNWTPHGGDPASAQVGRIAGRKLTLNDFIAAQRLTLLDMTLQTGRLPAAEQGAFINLQTWLRLLQLQAANAARLETQPEQLVEAIKENPLFRKDGSYDPELFQKFSTNFLSPQGFSGDRDRSRDRNSGQGRQKARADLANRIQDHLTDHLDGSSGHVKHNDPDLSLELWGPPSQMSGVSDVQVFLIKRTDGA